VRALGTILICLFALACSDTHSLTVDVRSDLAPGTDIIEVRTNLRRGAAVVASKIVPVGVDDPLGVAFRAAEFLDVEQGDYIVEAIGRGPTGSVRREAPVGLRSDEALLLLLPSACVGVVCPGSGDDLAATDCVAGRCEIPPCVGMCTPMDSGLDTGPLDTSPTDTTVPPPYPCPGVVDRINVFSSGVGAALSLAQRTHPSPTVAVIVHSDGAGVGGLSQSAVTAVGLARHLGGPLLLTPSDRLHGGVEDYIRTETTLNTIYIVGAEAAIVPAVETSVRAIRGAISVSRLGGAGNSQLAADIALIVDRGDGLAVVASRNDAALVQSALAASGAAALRRPFLFATNHAATLTAASTMGVTSIVVVGDTAAVPDSFATTLGSGITISARYDDASAFIEAVEVATGTAPSEIRGGLVPAANPLHTLTLGANGFPVLFVDSSSIPAATDDYLRASPIASVYLLGPTNDAVERAACAILAAP